MEPFIGQVMIFAGNFAPRGWALCDGQLLPINAHSALFSVLGTTYGGDGVTTFALPDLRGRAPIHAGQGPGLSAYRLGETVGAEQVTLTTGQIPAHRHDLGARTNKGKGIDATNNFLAQTDSKPYLDGPPDTKMGAEAIGETGGGGAHENRAPRLTLNCCIALEGIYPARS